MPGVIASMLLAAASLPAAAAGDPAAFFAVYEANRREGRPSYITEDFVALTYAMLVSDAATRYEEQEALPALEELAPRLRAGIGRATAPERTAQGFLAVFEALLAGAGSVTDASEAAAAELAAVRSGTGVRRSALMGQRVDYSQFKVRGKYAGRPALGRYFQAVRYAGAVLFPLLDSGASGIGAAEADILMGAALLISRAVSGDRRASALYARATEPLDYLFGPPDSMTVEHYAAAALRAGGRLDVGGPELPRLRLRLFARGERPRVLGGVLDASRLEPGVGAADALAGWQFLPARLTPESAAFQELVFDRVGGYAGDGDPFTKGVAGGREVKAFPSVWELGALLGSAYADEQLELAGDTAYEGYRQARERAELAMGEAAGLAGEHFAALRRWIASGGDGRRRVVPQRRLNTALGFWALQRHGSVLHARQSHTLAAKGIGLPPPQRRSAWIAPAAGLYGDLARMARGVGARTGYKPLLRFAGLAERCAAIAAQTAAGRMPGPQEADFLNRLDAELLGLTGRADSPLVADFHTDANSGQVVEIALLPAQPARVRTPRGADCRGALFSVHQFKRPMAGRLDDEGWQRLAAGPDVPPALIEADWGRGAGEADGAEGKGVRARPGRRGRQ